uniref:PDS5 cohesin associated factor B n=1 Tax=Stegastes partitus TaxID=144197 RepID=A0A3B5B682_9TELE
LKCIPLQYFPIFVIFFPLMYINRAGKKILGTLLSVAQEYIKQNPLALENLVSLLLEYVVPYMIHLLAHDPDFTKPHEHKRLKECVWFMLEVLMTKNKNNRHAFLRKMVKNIKQTKDAQCLEDAKANEKLYTVCDVALFVIANKSTACHLDSPKDPVLPSNFLKLLSANVSLTWSW